MAKTTSSKKRGLLMGERLIVILGCWMALQQVGTIMSLFVPTVPRGGQYYTTYDDAPNREKLEL